MTSFILHLEQVLRSIKSMETSNGLKMKSWLCWHAEYVTKNKRCVETLKAFF